MTYATIGRQNNDSERYLSTLGFNTEGKYNSNTFQIGARYTYNAKYDKEFKNMLNPYVAFN